MTLQTGDINNLTVHKHQFTNNQHHFSHRLTTY